MELDGPYGWRKLELSDLAGLKSQLVGLEGKTFAVLDRKREAKDIPVSDLRPPAQERLKQIGLEELDTVWELRLSSKRRVWGTVEGSVFCVLWWDPDEDVCGPPPKGRRRR